MTDSYTGINARFLIPVGVVQVLSDKGMRLNGAISIYLRHIHVIHKVDEFFSARRSKIPACLLLQRLLQNTYN